MCDRLRDESAPAAADLFTLWTKIKPRNKHRLSSYQTGEASHGLAASRASTVVTTNSQTHVSPPDTHHTKEHTRETKTHLLLKQQLTWEQPSSPQEADQTQTHSCSPLVSRLPSSPHLPTMPCVSLHLSSALWACLKSKVLLCVGPLSVSHWIKETVATEALAPVTPQTSTHTCLYTWQHSHLSTSRILYIWKHTLWSGLHLINIQRDNRGEGFKSKYLMNDNENS